MRRTIFSIFGFLAIFAMLFTVSCSNEPEIVPEVEPVETFDKTVLTAIAYPGMNFISWTPVVDAKEYTLFKHEGNVCVEAISFDHTDALFHIDTEIKNGVEYSYLVEVELNSSSNQVSDFANIEVNPISPKQMSERASVVAIVPDYDISVLELVNYEQPSGNHEFIVSSDNICIAKHNNDKISVSFPSKAYLNYDLILTVDNEYETLKEYNRCDDLSDDVRNDVFLSSNFLVTQAGTYKANIIVKSKNENFSGLSVVTSSESIEVPSLRGSGANIVSAQYRDFGGTIRVKFNKFIKKDGTSVPNSYYKLYRSEKGSKYLTLVEAQLKATDKTESTLYIDDSIYDNTKDYVYTLVVTDGSSYASSADTKDVVAYRNESKLSAELNVIAYPGMNYVFWSPIIGQTEYKLYRYEGDIYRGYLTFSDSAPLCYIDTEIRNDVRYSYVVDVNGNTSDKVTVTAIVPPSNVDALELVNYEQPSGNHEFIVSSDNICIAKHNNDKISVSFPSKAYLNYDLILTVDNEYETLKEYNICENLNNRLDNDVKNNDVMLYTNFLVTQAGTYKARVVAKSENEHFGDSDIITSDDSVVVSKLNGHGAKILDAKYKNTYIGNTIRVQFSKFELENGSPVPKYYYKLYRSEKGSRYFTLVDATIHATDNTENKFFVDDYIYDNTKDYVYTLVVTDGSSYASSADKREVESFTMATQLNTVIEGEQVLDYLQWNIVLPSSDVEINNIYILEKLLTDTEVVVPADFYSDGKIYPTTPKLISDTLYTLKTEHAIGTKVYMMVTTTQNGKDSGEWLSDSVIRERDERIASFCDEQGDEIERSVLVEDEDASYWNELCIPAIPQRDEYVSLYWRDSNYNTYYPGTITNLTSDETYFTPVYGRVAYFQDEYGSTVDSITVDNDGSDFWNNVYVPEIPQRDDYVALYWQDNNYNTYNPGIYIYLSNAETTFTPVYGRVAYFQDEYGSTVDSITVDNDGSYNWDQITLPEIPQRDVYVALYWRDSNYNTYYPGNHTYLITAEKIFTPVYGRVAYFQDEYGNTIADSITVDNDGSGSWNRITLPAIEERSGYEAYWVDSGYVKYYPGSSYYLLSTENYFIRVYEPYTNLTIGSEYIIGSTGGSGGSIEYYTFYANSGSSYTVSWLDSDNGNGGSELNNLLQDNESGVDVKVSIYSEDGMYEVCNNNDFGPQNFTAPTTGYYIIKVEPYYSGSSGYFAVKVE